MAIRAFLWGKVESKTGIRESIMLSFTGAGKLRFECQFPAAEWIVDNIFSTFATSKGWLVRLLSYPTTGDKVIMEWVPRTVKPTAKSVLKIGYQGKGYPSSYAPGTTATLLSYDEAMELAAAIRFVIRSARTQTAMATP